SLCRSLTGSQPVPTQRIFPRSDLFPRDDKWCRDTLFSTASPTTLRCRWIAIGCCRFPPTGLRSGAPLPFCSECSMSKVVSQFRQLLEVSATHWACAACVVSMLLASSAWAEEPLLVDLTSEKVVDTVVVGGIGDLGT